MMSRYLADLAGQCGKPLEGVPFEHGGEAIAAMTAMFFHALRDPNDENIDAGIDAIAADAKQWYRNLKSVAEAMRSGRDN